MEKREIMAALERNHWIQSQAAMDLGLTLRQIGYRVKQFGLERLIKEQRGQGLGGKLKSWPTGNAFPLKVPVGVRLALGLTAFLQKVTSCRQLLAFLTFLST